MPDQEDDNPGGATGNYVGEPPGNSFGSMIGALALGTIIASLGAIFCVALYHGYVKADTSRQRAEVPCVVERAWIEESRKTQDSPTAYRFRVEYVYEYKGTAYTGENVKRVDGATSLPSKAEALLKRFPEGLETVCYVDPGKPGDAILKHDTFAVIYTIWFPGLFVIGGVGIAVSGVRGWLRRRKEGGGTFNG